VKPDNSESQQKSGSYDPKEMNVINDRIQDLVWRIETQKSKNSHLKKVNEQLIFDIDIKKQENKNMFNQIFGHKKQFEKKKKKGNHLYSFIESGRAHFITEKDRESTMKEIHNIYELMFMPELKK
jgi:hypothetical protein